MAEAKTDTTGGGSASICQGNVAYWELVLGVSDFSTEERRRVEKNAHSQGISATQN